MSKILLIPSWYPTPQRPVFGIFVKKHVLEIARTHEVTVLYFDFNGTQSGEVKVQINRVNDIYDEIIVTLPGHGGVLSQLQKFILSGKYFNRFTRDQKFEFIHLNIPYHIGVFLSPWLLNGKTPLIITEHWSGYFKEDGRYDGLSFYKKYILKKLFQKAGKITAVSRPLAEVMMQKVTSGKPVEVLPNVINCNITPRPLLPEFENLKKFLFLGNLNDEEKNITGILDAFAVAVKERNDIRLIIAGGGKDEAMLKSHAAKAGLNSDVVEFRGMIPQPQLPALYAESVCLILNSYFETFSIAAAESILYGVPVISTKCYGPEEFVDDTNGLLIERGDSKKLTEAILHMAQNYGRFDSEKMSSLIRMKYCIDFSIMFDRIYTN